MNYQIADARTRFFNDKEHYLTFLRAWSRAVNSPNAKSTVNKFYGNKVDGWVTGAHMLLYALVRGQDIRTAFRPVTKQSRLENGAYINHGLYFAYVKLLRMGKFAAETDCNWKQECVEEFLAPFNGTLEKERLIALTKHMPTIEPLFSNYGEGCAIAEALINNPTDPWTTIEEAMQ